MKKLEEAISAFPELNQEDLDRWINDALIATQQEADHVMLTDMQFARVRLICTLRYDMDVEEEIIPTILDILDQLHVTRQNLHSLTQAVLAQDKDVKSSILDTLSQMRSHH